MTNGKNEDVNVVSPTHRPRLTPRNDPDIHFCQKCFISMKDSNDTIGIRIRDLPACSAVPRPSAPSHSPINGKGGTYVVWCSPYLVTFSFGNAKQLIQWIYSAQNIMSIQKFTVLPALYGWESWSLTLREEHRLNVFENRVLGEIDIWTK